jgi:hypothetical protein
MVAKNENLSQNIFFQERKREEKNVGRKLSLNSELTSHIIGCNHYYTLYSKRKLQL